VYVDDPSQFHTPKLLNEMLEYKTRLNLYLLLTVFLTVTACDMFGGNGDDGDQNSPPTASVTASTSEPVVGDTVRLDASKSDDPDGDKLTFNWTLETPDGSDATLSSPTAARPWYVPDASGDYSAEAEVSDNTLSDTDKVSITALKALPQTVTVPVENVAADGDTLVTGTVTWEDSVVAEDVMSANVEIPASRNEGQLCVQESNLFVGNCIALTPTGDISETQSISVQRKTVELTVDLDLPYGDRSQTDVTVYEPFRADSTKFTDENTVELAKRKQGLEREIDADLVTEEPERSDHRDRLTGETTVSAHENSDPTLSLDKLAACSDGISNDPADEDEELVDIWTDEDGNGFVDPGEGDPGCTSPDDDNEGHITWRKTLGSGGEGNNSDRFVSSEEGHRKIDWTEDPTLDIPESIKDAILINSRVEVKIEDDQGGEEFALELACGPNQETENLTDIVEDNNTEDGWAFARLRGITASWFQDGSKCSQSYIHASKVRGKEPGDGDDDVFFLVNGDGNIRVFQIRWTIEEEDNHKSSSNASRASSDVREEW
jgi:hypothetical protein